MFARERRVFVVSRRSGSASGHFPEHSFRDFAQSLKLCNGPFLSRYLTIELGELIAQRCIAWRLPRKS
jgi:hypothetical protein